VVEPVETGAAKVRAADVGVEVLERVAAAVAVDDQ